MPIMPIFDRPQSQWGEYKGNKFVTGFYWGENKNQIPIEGWYEVEIEKLIFRGRIPPLNPWQNLDEARNYVIDQVHKFIDNRTINQHLHEVNFGRH